MAFIFIYYILLDGVLFAIAKLGIGVTQSRHYVKVNQIGRKDGNIQSAFKIEEIVQFSVNTHIPIICFLRMVIQSESGRID